MRNRDAIALLTPRNWWFCPMIFTRPTLCSENSVKFSIRSSRRARSHVPRIITSSDTRRGSSSRSMRFHSKNRSQSAVSEPTRLSVPFEAMSSALNRITPESALLVARQIFVERRARGNTRLLQLDYHERQTVDEANQIRAAGVERAGEAELANEQEIIRSPRCSQSITRRRSVFCPPRLWSGTETLMPSLSSR